MSKVTIWHNPRCSKSRQALALLEATEAEVEIVLYLDNPPSRREINRVLKLLAVSPREILRKREDKYRELGLSDEDMTKTEIVGLMAENPKVIERPIVICGNKAAVGRPPELVLSVIE